LKNKAKIVATIGPASEAKDVLRQMILSGLNVARINCSHSKHEQMRSIVRDIRDLNDELEKNVAVLVDLQGPKIRIGEMQPNVVLEPGAKFRITCNEHIGSKDSAYISYEQFARDVQAGENILIDDGKLELKVISTDGAQEVQLEVVHGGPLHSRKGVNLPNTAISLPALTEKDREDLEVALELNAEWIGLSFVRSGDDVRELKDIVRARKSPSKVIAKIEKPEAIEDMVAIIEETDGVMVARGDLGVEIPMEQVPVIQKSLVTQSRRAGRPVIIATQMMESMIDNSRPTRAEANDVANSVLDGADAVMLSGETSTGRHPVAVIEAMVSIVTHTEEVFQPRRRDNPPKDVNDSRFVTDTICFNACKVAAQINARAILTMTDSGYAGIKIASHRPDCGIGVFTSNRSILNMLSLVWGVRGYYYEGFVSTDDTVHDIQEILRARGDLHSGDRVVNTASMPMNDKGMTNTLRVTVIS
jgi:pyruvate kinase